MITKAIIYVGGKLTVKIVGPLYDPSSDELGVGIDSLRLSLESAFTDIFECEDIEVVLPELGETYDDREEQRCSQ